MLEIALRSLGLALAVTGIARLAVAAISREPVNDSGFVPGVVLGFVLAAAAVFVWALAGMIRNRELGLPLAGLLFVAGWLVGGSYVVVWVEPGWAHELPMGTIVAPAAFAGFWLPPFLVFLVYVLTPTMLALAWLIDRVPFLRALWRRRSVPGRAAYARRVAPEGGALSEQGIGWSGREDSARPVPSAA